MKKISTFVIICILAASTFCSVNYVKAQKPYNYKFSDPILDKYRWKHFKELSGKNFSCFCEQANGTIWFGIENGILSFNGFKWTEYQIPEEKIGIGLINSMIFFGDTLFIGGELGIQTFFDEEWSNIKFYKNKPAVYSDMQGNGKPIFKTLIASEDVVLGTSTFGLYIRKNGHDHFYASQEVVNRWDTISKDIKFHTLPIFGKSVDYFFSNLQNDGNNTFFGFLSRTENKKQKSYFKFKLTDNNNNPLELLEDNIKGDLQIAGPVSSIKRSNGEIWVVSESFNMGLNIIRNNEWEYFSFKKNLNDSEVSWNIVELSDGSVFITSYGLVYRYYNNQWTKITSPIIPFTSMRTHAIFTETGDLWIGDENGEVYKIDYSAKHWTVYRNLNYQFTNTDSSLWFISDDNKVVIKKESNWYYYDKNDGLPSDPQTLYLTKSGTIWCGGSHNRVSATAFFINNKWKMQIHETLSWGIYHNAVAEDQNGDIWFGGTATAMRGKGQLGGGIKIHQVKDQIEVVHFLKTGHPSIFTFAMAGDGNKFYAGTDYGMREATDILSKKYTLDRTTYNRLYGTSSGSIWAATNRKGVLKFTEDKEDTLFYTKQGLKSNVIYDLYAENDSSVWAATNEGYSYFNGRYWVNNIFPQEFKLELGSGKISGVAKNIWISKFPIKWTLRAFNMLTFNGTDDFFSVHYKRDTMPPETEITLFFKEVASTGNTNIEWTGIDYMDCTSKSELLYSYRLNEQEWSIPTSKININLVDLNPGNYVFEVKAIDKDMNEDPTPFRVQFIVVRPVWQQTWFIILILSLLATIIYLYVRIIKRNKILAEVNDNLEHSQSELLQRNEEITQQNTYILNINHQLHKNKNEVELQNIKINKQKDKLISLNKTVKRINRLRINFFTNVSHEFRTPLTLILAHLEKIQSLWKKEDEIYNQLLVIKRNSYRLLHLINELMDFSKIEKKKMKPKLSQGNLVKFIEDTAQVFMGLARQRGITLKINSEEQELDTWFDYEIVEKILYNLISNAFKYTESNGVIEISTRIVIPQESISENINTKPLINIVPGWRYIEIKVKDSGIGIALENLENIFKQFYRVELSKTKAIGTGIGLSLTKQLVNIYQGNISVESELNKGSVFTVQIPIDDRFINEYDKETNTNYQIEAINNQVSILTDEFYATNMNGRVKEITSPKTDLNLDRILIVEDNDELRSFIISHFGALYNISEASNGVEGLKAAIEDSPQIIISDVMMPEMNGIELCKNLKNDLQTSHIPVILLTALSDVENQMKGLETGADDYISKPFNINILSIKVQNLLESRKKLRALFDKNIVVDSKSITTNSKDELFLQKALDIVSTNISLSEFDAKEFAEQMYVSQSLLYKKLINLTNQSISDFILSVRMKKATELIRDLSLNFTQIAYEVGFTDSRYFSSCFKKYFKKTPGEFRADLLEK